MQEIVVVGHSYIGQESIIWFKITLFKKKKTTTKKPPKNLKNFIYLHLKTCQYITLILNSVWVIRYTKYI